MSRLRLDDNSKLFFDWVTKYCCLFCFGGLAYVFSWSVWPLYLAGSFPMPVLPVGTTLSALLVISASEGRLGLRRWWQQIILWQVGMKWYLVAAGLPLLMFSGLVTLSLSGGILSLRIVGNVTQNWYMPLIAWLYYLFSPLSGALGEEPAYCGFVMPYLTEQRGYRFAPVALIIAVLWMGWHLPYFLTDGTNQPYIFPHLVLLVAQGVVYSWLYQNTCWSVPVAMLFHATINTLSYWLGPLFLEAGKAGLTCWWWGQVLGWSLIALWVTVLHSLK